MNAVMKSLLSHRSIRSYQDRPVSEEDLTQIIQAVQAAPGQCAACFGHRH